MSSTFTCPTRSGNQRRLPVSSAKNSSWLVVLNITRRRGNCVANSRRYLGTQTSCVWVMNALIDSIYLELSLRSSDISPTKRPRIFHERSSSFSAKEILVKNSIVGDIATILVDLPQPCSPTSTGTISAACFASRSQNTSCQSAVLA